MGRRVLLAAVAAVGVSLSLSCSAGAQEHVVPRSVYLRISQPGSLRGHGRFHGFAVFGLPRGWHIHRNAVDEVTIRRALSPQCPVHAYVSSTSSVANEAPSTQLRVGLPRASEPNQPVPLSVRTIADGRLTATSGAWLLVEPPAQARSFTFYGATLLKVRHARWAGITVGFVAPSGCVATRWPRGSVIAMLVKLLRTTVLREASFS